MRLNLACTSKSLGKLVGHVDGWTSLPEIQTLFGWISSTWIFLKSAAVNSDVARAKNHSPRDKCILTRCGGKS